MRILALNKWEMNEKELTHIDLFSGIGGFALAAKWAGFKTIAFCEKEKFCQKVLQKRFGAVIADSEYLRKLQSEGGKQNKRKWISNSPVLIPEIRDFDGTQYRDAALLTGGFPCQPFSVAGKRRGKEDDRYLWPEMLRVINQAKPRWILAENVPGIFRMALDTVLTDLEGEGYTTGTFIIPACGLNAPHRRNRVWIVAHSDTGGYSRNIRQKIPIRKSAPKSNSKSCSRNKGGDSIFNQKPNSHATDSDPRRVRRHKSKGIKERAVTRSGNKQVNPNSPKKRLSKPQESSFNESLSHAQRGDWEKGWYEVAAQFCRVDDGIPNRIHRLKALGNAIVPQIAYEIMEKIVWIERNVLNG